MCKSCSVCSQAEDRRRDSPRVKSRLTTQRKSGLERAVTVNVAHPALRLVPFNRPQLTVVGYLTIYASIDY